MNDRRTLPILAGLFVAAALLCATTALADDEAAKAEIVAHIHSIFQAFIDKDRDTIRATHSDDWTGFQTSARGITRGIDGYMANVGFANPMQRYELEDVEVRVHGDIAVVFYVAHWWSHVPSIELYVRQRARSVDIYERRDGEWIQTGSNINIMRRPGALQKEGSEAFFEIELAERLPE